MLPSKEISKLKTNRAQRNLLTIIRGIVRWTRISIKSPVLVHKLSMGSQSVRIHPHHQKNNLSNNRAFCSKIKATTQLCRIRTTLRFWRMTRAQRHTLIRTRCSWPWKTALSKKKNRSMKGILSIRSRSRPNRVKSYSSVKLVYKIFKMNKWAKSSSNKLMTKKVMIIATPI